VERGPFFLKLPPSPQQLANLTAIEAPNRMFLSPSVLGGWSHRPRADVMNGRTELWHTRLGVRRTDGTVDEADEFNRAMRVIWSPDYRDDPAKGPGFFPANTEGQNPFRSVPDAQHRHELVHLTANGTLDQWEQRFVHVQRFSMSALGSSMDVDYKFDPEP